MLSHPKTDARNMTKPYAILTPPRQPREVTVTDILPKTFLLTCFSRTPDCLRQCKSQVTATHWWQRGLLPSLCLFTHAHTIRHQARCPLAFRLTGRVEPGPAVSPYWVPRVAPSDSVPHHRLPRQPLATNPSVSDTIPRGCSLLPHSLLTLEEGRWALAFPVKRVGGDATRPLRALHTPACKGVGVGPGPRSQGALLRKAGWFLEF